MISSTTLERKADPSDVVQTFPNVNLQILCCRYWLLHEWESQNLAFPFWRLYYNTFGNASVIFKGEQIPLHAGQLLLIPPFTSYSARLKTTDAPSEKIEGRKIVVEDRNLYKQFPGACDHLFIHFNLGTSYDLIKPTIFRFPCSASTSDLLHSIMDFCKENGKHFDFQTYSLIQQLLFGLLKEIPTVSWDRNFLDKRVQWSMTYMDEHLEQRITINTLAQKTNLAESSFSRLFRQETGITVHRYLKKKRVERVMTLLHHSSFDLETLASLSGFTDRFHLSKVFKEHTGRSPVTYRKLLVL